MSHYKTWRLKTPSHHGFRLAHEASLTPLQAQLLINRGILDASTAASFFSPRLTGMADPLLMKDMDEATETIVRSIEDREKITIYGDYDADGLTAAALLFHFLSKLGVHVSIYIPNRLGQGYGLDGEAIKNIAGRGTGLIITVDCGTTDEAMITLAGELGVRVVVTDHHRIPMGFKPICPVVNPQRADCPFPFKDLAGVGVSFLLAVSLRSALRQKGWFRGGDEPDLREYLDLVAVGTVADRAPLLGENRIFVSYGLEMLKKTRRAGLKALKRVAGVEDAWMTASDVAYRIAPLLNAPGRIIGPELGIQILTVEEERLAGELALRISDMNNTRQGLEKQILSQIEELLEDEGDVMSRKAIVMAGEQWHPGVLGIVASKLVGKYHRPSLVFSIRDGLAIGSGRSIHGFNLHKALSRLGHLLQKFGGHALAAGLSLQKKNLNRLAREFEGLAQDSLTAEDLAPAIDVDAKMELEDVTYEILHDIAMLSPFGEGNPDPVFYVDSMRVSASRVVGDNHLKLELKKGERSFETIGFDQWNGNSLEDKTIDMVFTPEVNYWQGYKRIQFRLIDFEESGSRSRLVLEDPGSQFNVLRAEDE